MSTESWPQYVTRISGGARGVDISRATGVSESTITRWRDGKQPTPSAAVSVARAYDQNPLEALIVAGYLNVDEMKQHITVRLVPLSDLSDVELAHELLSRAEAAADRNPEPDPEPPAVDIATMDEDQLLQAVPHQRQGCHTNH